jgi:hypothetical protein
MILFQSLSSSQVPAHVNYHILPHSSPVAWEYLAGCDRCEPKEAQEREFWPVGPPVRLGDSFDTCTTVRTFLNIKLASSSLN